MVATQGTIAFGGQTIDWHLAPSLVQLAGQLAAAHPGIVIYAIAGSADAAAGRPTYDASGRGTSGTDHLPDDEDEVLAIDAMHGTGSPAFDAHAFFDVQRAAPHADLNYMELENVVAGRKIEAARDHGFAPTDVGPSSAGPHVHVSGLHGLRAADTAAWTIAPPTPVPAPTPHPLLSEDDMAHLIQRGNDIQHVAISNGFVKRQLAGATNVANYAKVLGEPVIVTDDEYNNMPDAT